MSVSFGWSLDAARVHWLRPWPVSRLTSVCAGTAKHVVVMRNGQDATVFSHVLELGLPFFSRALSLQVLLAA